MLAHDVAAGTVGPGFAAPYYRARGGLCGRDFGGRAGYKATLRCLSWDFRGRRWPSRGRRGRSDHVRLCHGNGHAFLASRSSFGFRVCEKRRSRG